MNQIILTFSGENRRFNNFSKQYLPIINQVLRIFKISPNYVSFPNLRKKKKKNKRGGIRKEKKKGGIGKEKRIKKK